MVVGNVVAVASVITGWGVKVTLGTVESKAVGVSGAVHALVNTIIVNTSINDPNKRLFTNPLESNCSILALIGIEGSRGVTTLNIWRIHQDIDTGSMLDFEMISERNLPNNFN